MEDFYVPTENDEAPMPTATIPPTSPFPTVPLPTTIMMNGLVVPVWSAIIPFGMLVAVTTVGRGSRGRAAARKVGKKSSSGTLTA